MRSEALARGDFSSPLPASASVLARGLQAFPTLRDPIETILPVPIAPWEADLGVSIIIAASREEGVDVATRLTELAAD